MHKDKLLKPHGGLEVQASLTSYALLPRLARFLPLQDPLLPSTTSNLLNIPPTTADSIMFSGDHFSNLKTQFAIRAPFSDDPGADLVLISCDNFKFRVRTSILSLASPIINDMLSLPQPASVEKNKAFAPDVISLPSVQLSETAQVIDLLLRYSYPVSNPRNGVDLDALVSVLSASEKYEMYFVREEVELLIKKSYAKDPRYCMLYLHRSFGHRSKLEFAHYALTCLEYPLVSLVKGRQVNSPENLLPTLIEYHQAASLKIGEYISSYTYTKSKQPVNSRTIRFPGPYEGVRSYPNCPFCSWDAAGTKEPQWI